MTGKRKDTNIDITRNIKIMDWLKSQLLADVALLFKSMVSGAKEEVRDAAADAVSNIIIVTYLLARRLGITYNAIELKIQKKIRLGIIEEHDVEKYYGDLSELSHHLSFNRASERKG